MKIAVYTNAYKPIVSGVVNAIDLFRQGLIDQGNEVVVFAPDYYGHRDQEPGIYRYPSVDLSRQVRFPVAVPWSARLGRVLREFRPDIIHTHHPFVLGPVAMREAHDLHVPLVYTFHTQYEQYAHYVPLPQDLVRRMTRHRIGSFASRADLVTTPAESVRDLLLSYGVRREIVIVPNPIDLSLFDYRDGGSVRRQLGLADGELVLISVGRLGVEKNLGFMLESFAFMLEQGRDLPMRLVLVGSGPDEARLKELARRLGVEKAVIFAGSVPYPAVPSYLSAADIFLMTSISEVKPLVLLEAMGAELPVVAIRASGAVDTVMDGEGLLTALDQHEFARAVLELLRDKERRVAMGKKAAETVGRYRLDKVAGQMNGVFSRAIAEYRRGKGS